MFNSRCMFGSEDHDGHEINTGVHIWKKCYYGLRFRATFPCLTKLSCQFQVLLFLVQYYTVGKILGLAVILRALNSKSQFFLFCTQL